MITAKFMTDHGQTVGFAVSGHSGYAEAGSDIVCAAVSSAVGLCECAITDVIGAAAKVTVDPESAAVQLRLSEDSPAARDMISALMLHLVAIRDEYPEYIEVLEV